MKIIRTGPQVACISHVQCGSYAAPARKIKDQSTHKQEATKPYLQKIDSLSAKNNKDRTEQYCQPVPYSAIQQCNTAVAHTYMRNDLRSSQPRP